MFQFHMVRLKVPTDALPFEYINAFQFHMVRLKGLSLRDIIDSYSRFQFHMVRLKVVGRKNAGIIREIVSIPHGTIKSMTSNLKKCALFYVSIPHGTIKRG